MKWHRKSAYEYCCNPRAKVFIITSTDEYRNFFMRTEAKCINQDKQSCKFCAIGQNIKYNTRVAMWLPFFCCSFIFAVLRKQNQLSGKPVEVRVKGRDSLSQTVCKSIKTQTHFFLIFSGCTCMKPKLIYIQ